MVPILAISQMRAIDTEAIGGDLRLPRHGAVSVPRPGKHR